MKAGAIVVSQILSLPVFVGCSMQTHETYLVLGHGASRPAWCEIEYDESVKGCRANLMESDMGRHVPELIAEAYPNLADLSVQCFGLESDSSLDIDCRELLNATNIVDLEICNHAGTVRNITEICSDKRKKNVTISFSPGEKLYQHENICCAFDDSPVDKADCIIGSGVDCTLEVEVFGGVYCFDDNVHRNARFSNTGDGVIGIRKFPLSCNTVELFGAFDLSKVGVCESVNMLAWVYDGENFQQYISEINSERFPNLRFLRLLLSAERECRIDFGPLAKLTGVKVIELQLSEIIPYNIDVLYGIEGLWGVVGFINVYRYGK